MLDNMIITKKIVLEPHQLQVVKNEIINKSKEMFENTLVFEGFVTRVNEIKKISHGRIQHSPLCGVEYNVDIDVDVFNIHVNDIVNVKITNINGMGMFGKFEHATVFVPHHEIKNIDDTEKILHVVDDTVRVRIIGKRITDEILCVGTEKVDDAL